MRKTAFPNQEFHSQLAFQPGSLRRNFARRVFTLISFFCLLTVFLLIGCRMEDNEREDTGFIPIGLWESAYDSYKITSTSLDYLMDASEWGGDDDILKGTIVRAVDFSDTAGVLIIKVTETGGFIGNTVGKYTGVYYKDYTGSSIVLANAINLTDWSPVEASSESAALSLFTVDNSDLHVSWDGITPYIFTPDTQ